MSIRRLSGSTLVFAVLSLTGCSGGGGSGSSVTPGVCGEAAVFCLTSCSVGCSSTGCEIREIAQNQQIRFQFSQDVDPRTVDFTTISLKTPTGEEPVGEFVVEGSVITFVPAVRSIGAATFFGFAPNQEYVLTLPGGTSSTVVLRSTAGDILTEQFSCTIRASLGVVDLDGQPPRATVISPTQDTNGEVPRDSQFVLRFSEIIDQGPFVSNPVGVDAPVQFLLLPRGNGGICQTAAMDPPQIFGTVRLQDDTVSNSSTLTFVPSAPLPGNRCIDVRVTGRVRDVAGTAALPQSFLFRIDSGSVIEGVVDETFDTTTNFDNARSAGRWGDGTASFFSLGGDGRHGDFDHELGAFNAATGEWVFDTGAIWVGDDNALLASDLPNGQYHFSSFVIPEGTKVRFTGTFPAVFRVRGECDIRGELLLGGANVPAYTTAFNATNNQPGQPGGEPGPGGGRGGQGGQQANGIAAVPANSGSAGENIRVPATHAYAAQVAGTGGSGSTVFPVNGSLSSVVSNIFSYSGTVTNGGGGGGFVTAGGDGDVIATGRSQGDPTVVPEPATSTAGGVAFPLTPIPAVPSIDHFMVGGAGGGGGGSHPFYQRSRFIAGAAGGGGGGAAAIRVGRRFAIGPNGVLSNRGGSAFNQVTTQGIGALLPAPGGGGSGGSVLVQLSRNEDVALLGTVDVRGGGGGGHLLNGPLFRGNTQGGNGGDGVFRIEAPTPLNTATWPLTTFPAPTPDTSAAMTARDDLAAIASRVYDSGQSVAPVFRRYIIEATIDGVPTTFSDDAAVGVEATTGSPLRVFFQGVRIDPATGQPTEDVTAWFTRVGTTAGIQSLNDGQRTGFRWIVVADRAVANDIVLNSVKVVYEF